MDFLKLIGRLIAPIVKWFTRPPAPKRPTPKPTVQTPKAATPTAPTPYIVSEESDDEEREAEAKRQREMKAKVQRFDQDIARKSVSSQPRYRTQILADEDDTPRLVKP